ncbi:MAG: hypothetical protein JNL87_23230 [Burkholderiaceae bacterium]|nr:hypothetical protein [Burkholderiaceae bacterium]
MATWTLPRHSARPDAMNRSASQTPRQFRPNGTVPVSISQGCSRAGRRQAIASSAGTSPI